MINVKIELEEIKQQILDYIGSGKMNETLEWLNLNENEDFRSGVMLGLTLAKGLTNQCQKYYDNDGELVPKKWLKLSGFTPGGDPAYMCPTCMDVRSEHINGIEHRKDWKYCPYCGERLDY